MNIPCQAEHKEGQGCYTCGGYKIVLSQEPVCVSCNRMGWIKPGANTSYVGKVWVTFDGLVMLQGAAGSVCAKCVGTKY